MKKEEYNNIKEDRRARDRRVTVESILEGYITRCFYVTTNQGMTYTVAATILPITPLLEVYNDEEGEIPELIQMVVKNAVFSRLKQED
ncbi:MAG: hypothetical protein IMF19_12195, partial [Proteobacteria bacterium]|nr:hypothetical protein [Pseudomonadota bacterium]